MFSSLRWKRLSRNKLRSAVVTPWSRFLNFLLFPLFLLGWICALEVNFWPCTVEINCCFIRFPSFYPSDFSYYWCWSWNWRNQNLICFLAFHFLYLFLYFSLTSDLMPFSRWMAFSQIITRYYTSKQSPKVRWWSFGTWVAWRKFFSLLLDPFPCCFLFNGLELPPWERVLDPSCSFGFQYWPFWACWTSATTLRCLLPWARIMGYIP